MRTVLTSEEVEGFAESGVVHLREALPRAFALEVQEAIWRNLGRLGVDRERPETWYEESWLKWRAELGKGLPRSPLGESDRFVAAMGELLGGADWAVGRTFGAPLVTPPDRVRGAWKLSSRGWHWDGAWRMRWGPEDGLFLFIVLSTIAPRSGGTLLVEGSRRLFDDFCANLPPEERRYTAGSHGFRERFLDSHPYLRQLSGRDPVSWEDPEGFFEPHVDGEGRRLRVVEVTGEPGDVFICQSLILHAAPQHHGTVPRFIRPELMRPAKSGASRLRSGSAASRRSSASRGGESP